MSKLIFFTHYVHASLALVMNRTGGTNGAADSTDTRVAPSSAHQGKPLRIREEASMATEISDSTPSHPKSVHMRLARGVVPHQPDDPVLKAPYAHGAAIFVSLRPDLDRPSLEAWLSEVETHVQALRNAYDADGNRLATVAVGFAPSFFMADSAGQRRFPDVAPPVGFGQLPPMPLGAPVPADVVFYVVATAEAEIAKFLTGVAATSPDIVALEVEQGYKSFPDKEAFGYADGVRNARQSRNDVVFVDPDRQPEEPRWAVGGTYLTFLRISQDVAAFGQLPSAEQDGIVGRDRSGRRLDLPQGTPVDDEGDFTGDVPPMKSHVRKVGPRGGADRDGTQIFRRGLAFYEVIDGQVVQGLQFVSFQASIDQFDAVYGRWMLNADFPRMGSGQDAMVARGLVSVERWGFFFVPPDTDDAIGTIMLKPTPETRKTKTGRVAVRKTLLDASGVPSRGDLGGFTFQITTVDNAPVGNPFTTNSHGHALSDEIETGDYVLTELAPRPPQPPMNPAPPQPFTLHSAQEVRHVENRLSPGAGRYGE